MNMIITQKYIQQHIKDNNIDTTRPFVLILSNSQLTSIEKGAFDGLNNLESLNLHNNNLTSIEKGTLDGLNKLESLDLSHNKIPNIENRFYTSREEILELIKQLNSLDSEVKNVSNVDCLIDGNTTLNDIKDSIDKHKQEIIQEIINFLSK